MVGLGRFSYNYILYQGSTSSPYLFALVLDVLIEYVQDPVPQYMLFVDDVILVGESRKENKL